MFLFAFGRKQKQEAGREADTRQGAGGRGQEAGSRKVYGAGGRKQEAGSRGWRFLLIHRSKGGMRQGRQEQGRQEQEA